MTTHLVTVYGIREGRGYKEAASLLGADFEGVLVRDGWAIYPIELGQVAVSVPCMPDSRCPGRSQ